MNTPLKLVYDANANKSEKKDETNFDALFTPDPDFEKQLPVWSTSSQLWKTNSEPFPELILDDFQIPDEIWPAQPMVQTQKNIKTQVDQALRFPKVIVDEVQEEKTIDKKEVQYLSTLEQKSVFYANRFQEILQMYPTDTLENTVKRYAKILLYMLEQFHIISEKKHQVKFMVSLKRILWEFDFEMDAIDYKNWVLKRGYIYPDQEFKEELEFLYKIYYECYKVAHKELHKFQKALDKIEREKLHQHITNLEREVLPFFHPDAPEYDSRNFPKNWGKSDT